MADEITCAKDWQERPPAKLTLELLKEKEKQIYELKERDNQFALTAQSMGDKIDNIAEKLDNHIQQQKDDFNEMKTTLKGFIGSADGKYADKEQFLFWRWVLIGGVILSAAIGIWFKR